MPPAHNCVSELLVMINLPLDAQNDIDVEPPADGSACVAQRWADHGKLVKIAVVRGYLREDEYDTVDKLLIDQPGQFPGSLFLILRVLQRYNNTGQFVIEFYIGCSSQTLLL
ncbi:hypothetical protein BYT27DRAFT_7190623, partial [Phlegmacium glaucopus]